MMPPEGRASSTAEPDADVTQQRSAAPSRVPASDRLLLRMGAVAGVTGLLLQVVMDRLHPHRTHPNDSPAAFREYAASGAWTYVHIGQYLGTLLIVLALLTLARRLSHEPPLARALAHAGMVTAVVVAAVFTVQMAVDGVALRDAVQTWMAAPSGPSKVSALQVAEAVRSVEKGLGGFFQISDGLTLLCLGLSLAVGAVYARWLGWVGAVAGAAFVVGGALTARTGFSTEAGLFLTPALLLFAVFLVGACVSLWRESGRVTP